MRTSRWTAAVGLLLLSAGCRQEVESTSFASTQDPERPWEVRTDQGETVLPYLYYAEAAENEQIMPTAIHGRNGIDHLIYPTIGNPNLYVKSDPEDSVLVVLRLEPELFDHLEPERMGEIANASRSHLALTEDGDDRLAFHLIARGGRDSLTTAAEPIAPSGDEGISVTPTEIQIHDDPADTPAPFRQRNTLRVLFRQEAMSAVTPGLYDLRVEVVREGQLVTVEHQYNAISVFDAIDADDRYTALEVTDTQLSVGDLWGEKSEPMLRSFVDYVNHSTEPEVAQAAFITFNGDLHNGGSPGSLREETVATTYNREAEIVVDALKELDKPIFLTAGNHDGQVSTGYVPPSVETFSKQDGLRQAVESAEPKAWPDFDWETFQTYRAETAETHRGGRPLDVFLGRFVRRAGARTFEEGFFELPPSERNMILYDGFYQWRRTYGPLSYSWSFGDNLYVSINSFDVRQHRRSGWGMYVVNYGGGISDVQLEWIERELERAETMDRDVVLLAHHDPRGGHKGEDHGYYAEQVAFRGIGQSAMDYLQGKVITPVLCKLPDWALKDSTETDCLHDGLQEWLRPDPDFDCDWTDRLDDGRCDPRLLDPQADEPGHLTFSGLSLIDQIATHPRVRTMLLGHTHYNELTMLQSGEAIVSPTFALSPAEAEALAALEVTNPVRGHAYSNPEGSPDGDFDPNAIDLQAIIQNNALLFLLQAAAADEVELELKGDRELAIIRLTSNADLTGQKYDGATMMGFSVLHVSPRPDYGPSQINAITYFINRGSGVFDPVAKVGLDRRSPLGADDEANPVSQLFD